MRAVIIIMILTAVAGCDATLQGLRTPAQSPADTYRSRAMEFEQASEMRKALLAWRVAGHIDQKDTVITGHIGRLEAKIAAKAKADFQKGVALYEKGKTAEARRAFLKVLRLNPGHKQAFHYLKRRLPHGPGSIYKVQPGDSFTKIATTRYQDPQKAYAVAFFNDLDPRKPLSIGKELILPDLDAKYLYPRSDIEAYLAQAREALAQKQLVRARSLALKIMEEVPGHAQARQLLETARFEYSMDLKRRGRYPEALEQLELMTSDPKGRRQAMVEIQRLISRQTLEKKLDEARNQLSGGNPKGAISMTESILADHPRHDQARALKNEAGYMLGKALIDQGRESEAIEWLEKIDSDYADTAIQLSLARSRTKTAAEEHYRNGVKHFINEDLESAIKAWRKALDLNPDHPKASQDMENATRLLEKWQKLEKPQPE